LYEPKPADDEALIEWLKGEMRLSAHQHAGAGCGKDAIVASNLIAMGRTHGT
jgi:hypothetical protein